MVSCESRSHFGTAYICPRDVGVNFPWTPSSLFWRPGRQGGECFTLKYCVTAPSRRIAKPVHPDTDVCH